jgi:ABC-type multidrug transport system fused ATPase/permease subunit
MQQTLSSIKIIQAYARESFTNSIYKNHLLQNNDASITSTKVSTIYNTLTGILSGIAGAIVVGIGAYNALHGSMSIGDLFVFIGYIGALFGPVNSLAGIIQTSLTITVRAGRVFDILDSKEVIHEKPDAISLTGVQGNIELKSVSFGYGQKGEVREILHDFTLKVPHGKIVAIVGPTGAGKTSMISMLLRFYDPWEGEILLDGYNLKDLKLDSLRNNISLVLQDALIFPLTLRENIGFGDHEATIDEIMEAAKIAQAHDFIMKLPEGYETVASEGGVSLSGGEKQRISLARAFLRKSPILILDEPTSAMDVQTESKIFGALSEYSSGRTVFIISHRLSTIKHADMILTIKDGVLVEQGTHEALVKGGNVYSELYKFQ